MGGGGAEGAVRGRGSIFRGDFIDSHPAWVNRELANVACFNRPPGHTVRKGSEHSCLRISNMENGDFVKTMVLALA